MRKGWRVLAVVALVVLAFAATGCEQIIGGAVKGAVEKSTGVSVDENSNSVTFKGKEGEVTIGDNATIPEGFPEDVPVYEGKITTSLKTTEGFSLGIDTEDTPKDVFDWYLSELEDKGWKVEAQAQAADGFNIGAKNDEWSLAVTGGGNKDEGKTTVVISVQKNKD